MSNSPKAKLYLPKHCFIPIALRQNKDIPDAAKIYFGELNCLSSSTGKVWAEDESLAEMKDVSVKTIKNWNRSLREAGFMSSTRSRVKHTNEKGEDWWENKREMFLCEEGRIKEKICQGQEITLHCEGQEITLPYEENIIETTNLEKGGGIFEKLKDIHGFDDEYLQRLQKTVKSRGLTDAQLMNASKALQKKCEGNFPADDPPAWFMWAILNPDKAKTGGQESKDAQKVETLLQGTSVRYTEFEQYWDLWVEGKPSEHVYKSDPEFDQKLKKIIEELDSN